ncbi:MAG: DUF3857 domain-containing protein [Opitutaceae bacterium]
MTINLPFRLLPLLLLTLSFFGTFSFASEETVSRTPPAIYAEQLAPLLTSFEDAINEPNVYEEDETGVIILNERVHYVTESGLRYSALHCIYKANTEAGLDALAEDIYSYRKGNQRIYLVEARTIQPDGQIQPVRDNAAVLQSPQNDAEDAIYNDEGELLLIFPNIKPGSITEAIIVIEETAPRVEGEIMLSFGWTTNWPRISKRRLVSMPAQFAARYQITNIGSGAPTPQRTEVSENRVQFLWESKNTPRSPYEYQRAPSSQTGPYTRTTTWKSWDDLAKWYAELIEEEALSDQLKEAVEDRTLGLESKREIIEAVHAMIASDVRYTGLEFGISGYKPYKPSEVWERGYGDCKDKSNLLRKCLELKGIQSHLCLLTTRHLGRVEKRSPSTGQFNHVVLAIEDPDNPGALIFSDPTISKSYPGLISPNDGDRDVLLLTGQTSKWVRTPPQSAGGLDYKFDLSLSKSGETSGWLDFKASGYYACGYLKSYEQRSAQDRKRSMQDLVEDFFPNAEVIDTEVVQMTTAREPFNIRAYFLIPGTQTTEGETTTVSLPTLDTIIPYLGDSSERRTPRYLWQDSITLDLSVEYPETWKPMQMPEDYSVSSPAFTAVGKWENTSNTCRSQLSLDCTKSSILSDEFAATFNATKSFSVWSERPAHYQKAGGSTEDYNNGQNSNSPLELPIMPTADGQLSLINSKYPSSGNLDLRRQALQKLILYFPTDQSSIFNARVGLAYIDYKNDVNEQAAEDLLVLIDELGSAADIEDLHWAKYLRGLCLEDAEQEEQAKAIYLSIYSNQQVSDYRRAWSAYRASLLLSESDANEAIQLIRETGSLDSNAQKYLHVLLIELLTDSDQLDLANETLQSLKDQNHPYLGDISIALIRDAQEKLNNAESTQAKQIFDVLVNSGLETGDHVDDQITEEFFALQTEIENQIVAQQLRSRVSTLIESKKPAYCDEYSLDTNLESREQFVSALEQFEENSENGSFLIHCVELLTRFEPNQDFYFYLWRAAAYIEWMERPNNEANFAEPFFPEFIKICEDIPQTDTNYFESQFLKSTYYRNLDDFQKEASVYESLLENPNYPETFNISTYSRWALALEKLDNYSSALEKYTFLETEVGDSSRAISALTRAIYINLDLGNLEEARRIVALLENTPADLRKEATADLQLNELILLHNRPEGLITFWKQQEAWQSDWQSLFSSFAPDFVSEKEIPVFDDFTFTQDMFASVQENDAASFLINYHGLAEAARWESNAVNQLARLSIYGAMELFPEHASKIRDFIIKLYESYIPGDEENETAATLYFAIALIDNQLPEKALEVIGNFQERLPKLEDSTSQAILYLKVISEQAAGKATDISMAQLEGLLTSDIKVHDRERAINTLANLYRSAGSLKKEETLLKNEIEHADIKNNADSLKRLTARYSNLAKTGQASEEFSKLTASWLEANEPQWFKLSEPQSIDEFSQSRLQQLIENPESRYNPLETIKFQFLVARDSDKDLEDKWSAFSSAVTALAYQKQNYAEIFDLYSAISSDDSFTLDQQRYFALVALGTASITLDKEQIRRNVDHPSYDQDNPDFKAGLSVYKTSIERDWKNAEDLFSYYKEFAEIEFAYGHFITAQRIFTTLLELGETEKAESILDDVVAWNFSPNIDATKTSVRLELFKSLKTHKKNKALNVAMSNAIRNAFALDGSFKRPDLLDQVYKDELPGWLSEQDHSAIGLYLVDQNLCFNWQPFQWLNLIRNTHMQDRAGLDRTSNLINLWIENTHDDMERSWISIYAPGMLDLDDAKIRERTLNLLEKYNDSKEYPLSNETYDFLKLQIELRLGEEKNLELILEALNHPFITEHKANVKMLHYLIHDKQTDLRNFIDNMEAVEMENPNNLPFVMSSLSALKMDDELEILTDHAIKTRNRLLVSSWASYNIEDAILTLDLTQRIGDPETIPSQWFQEVSAGHREPRDIAMFEVAYLELMQDWEQLATTAEKHTKTYPSFYAFYWRHALALHKLGKDEQALKPLKVYTNYSKDEFNYIKASKLLESIEKAKLKD